jgi:threonine aldolase
MSGRGFASDNGAGALPEVMAAIAAANRGHARAYGDDPWSARAIERLRAELGAEAEVFFVFGGTGANVVALAAALAPHEAVLCAAGAHLAVDECGAPERFVGCKVVTIASGDGKLDPAALVPHLAGVGDVHRVQPRLLSISQSTERGTVYRPAEIAELAEFAHRNGLLLHVDGARLANAAAALGVRFGALARAVGVDLLSLGGTKCGMLYGEAVVAFEPTLAARLAWARKQAGQLPSKLRFVAAQFEALLEDDLALRAAAHANRMARLLAARLAAVPGVRVEREPEANAVFATLPVAAIAPLAERYFFHLWDESPALARFMTAFDTTEGDVEELAAALLAAVEASGAADD